MSEIIVAPNGMLRFIYDDDLAAVARDIGTLTMTRASHVEPTEDGQWTADMEPCGGPVLGPFSTRKAALAAEHAWIEDRDVPIPRR